MELPNMTRIGWEMVFWISLCWMGYVYFGYPLALWLLKRIRTYPAASSLGALPTVSVVISARNEKKDIGWKVAETLAWDYPNERLELLVASDDSTDGTDEILEKVADPRFRYIQLKPRQGKNEALNRLVELAQGELLFFSDANSHIEPTCLREMASHFADPRVGCVTGSERTIQEDERFGVATGTHAFLGYESLLNGLESKLGSVLVCDGSIFCIRRKLFETLQPDLANDFELPIRIGARGEVILYDPLAISWEKATSAVSEEFHRRRRICGQGILGFWRLRHCIKGFRAWQLFSRKFLRWLGAIPLAFVLVSNLMLVPAAPFYAFSLGTQVIFYVLSLLGWWLATSNRQGSRLATFPFYFVMANVGALVGVISSMFGLRFSTWESAVHSRGTLAEKSHAYESRKPGIVERVRASGFPASQTPTAEPNPEKHIL